MRGTREFSHTAKGQHVELQVIDDPTEADVAVLLTGNQKHAIARVLANGVAIGGVLIASNTTSDIDRVLELLGMMPLLLREERWRPC